MTFVPDVTAALSAPLTLHPNRTGMWRTPVVAADPDVAVAVPAVVATDPDPIAVLTGRNRNDFDRARWGRSNADNNLCIRRTGCEQDHSSRGE
jgi:hypothetical protein